MNAVGPDQNVGCNARAVVEPRFDIPADVAEPDEAVAEMDVTCGAP